MNTRPPKQLEHVRDPPRAVRVEFQVRMTECDLAPERFESHPTLQLFLSDHFVREPESGGVVNVHMDKTADNPAYVYTGAVIGTLKREHREIPPRAAIGAYLYAVHRNAHGSPCYVEVGTNHVDLRDVSAQLAKKKDYVHSMNMMVRTVVISGAEPIKKGVVELRVTGIQHGPAVKSCSGHVASALDAAMGEVEQSLAEYVHATMMMEQQLPDTFPNTERMRAPADLSPTGVESTGRAFLPVAAFALVPTPRANDGYFLNALQNVMARREQHISEYVGMSLDQRARTMAAVSCYGVQTFDYIADKVELLNRRGVQHVNSYLNMRHQTLDTDSWSNIWRTCSGDCEDGCRGIQCTLRALKAVAASHPAVVDMQRIASRYIAMQALTVVHGAKIGDHEGYGAHLCDLFTPIEGANAMLKHTTAGRSLLKRTRAPEAPVASATMTAVEQLPFMVGEGTGVIDPLGVEHDPILEQRKYVAQMLPSTSTFKREIPHVRGQASPFYHGHVLVITDHWWRNHNMPIGALVMGIPSNQQHEMSRGILWTDFMAGRTDRIALMPQPPMSKTVENICHEALALTPPTRPLELGAEAECPEPDALLNKLVGGIKAMGRSNTSAQRPAASVDLYVRAHQYDEERIAQLLAEIAQAPLIYDAEVVRERITDTIDSHRIRLWVSPPAADPIGNVLQEAAWGTALRTQSGVDAARRKIKDLKRVLKSGAKLTPSQMRSLSDIEDAAWGLHNRNAAFLGTRKPDWSEIAKAARRVLMRGK